jgi:Uma2 family endonuclease
VRAVLLEVPEAMLAERRRLGLDKRDEMWDSVLHMVPPPGGEHQRLGTQLIRVLAPLAERLGLISSYETGLYRSADDWRIPDQLYYRPEQRSDRGAEGAELVIEIRSKGDETDGKKDFYAGLGVREMLIVQPEGRTFDLLRLVGDQWLVVSSNAEGGVRSEVLGAQFATVEGRLQITWQDGTADI